MVVPVIGDTAHLWCPADISLIMVNLSKGDCDRITDLHVSIVDKHCEEIPSAFIVEIPEGVGCRHPDILAFVPEIDHKILKGLFSKDIAHFLDTLNPG